uniref:Uncharacterized protein n=1 Tax=Tetraselmis sp. GSL018 TaxID=582737 RepID=A0A061S9U5_9CHLO
MTGAHCRMSTSKRVLTDSDSDSDDAPLIKPQSDYQKLMKFRRQYPHYKMPFLPDNLFYELFCKYYNDHPNEPKPWEVTIHKKTRRADRTPLQKALRRQRYKQNKQERKKNEAQQSKNEAVNSE